VVLTRRLRSSGVLGDLAVRGRGFGAVADGVVGVMRLLAVGFGDVGQAPGGIVAVLADVA